MFRRIDDFLNAWKAESESTLRLFSELTDASLAQSVEPGGYSLGSLAWHITGSIAAIPAHAGLLPMPPKDPAPAMVTEIRKTYEKNSAQLAEVVKKQWTDAQLGEAISLFGRDVERGKVLLIIIQHQAHHRAQMTVLMRQAGLKVPGMYGPSADDVAAAKSKK